MARHTYAAAKSEPGIIAALDCHAPCKGWVVLYDRKKGGLPEMKAAGVKLADTGRFVLVHRPSGRWTGGFKSEAEARAIMRAAAKGEDPNDILPKTVTSSVVPALAGSGANEPTVELLVKKLKPRARAHATPDAKIEDNPPKDETPPPAPPMDFHATFKHEVQSRLIPSLVVDTILAMLSAEKTFMVGKGDDAHLETAPDWYARSLGVKLAAEYGDGKPVERPDVKQQKKVTFDELRVMCLQSPATRRAMRKLIEEAEAEAARLTAQPQTSKTT